MNLKNKNILIVGMGKSGVAAMKTLVELGAVVSIQDSKTIDQIDKFILNFVVENEIKYYFGEKPSLEKVELIVVSPGVSLDKKFLIEASKQGIEIVGEIEIAYQIGKGKYIAITGTNGKTTTTTLVGEIFEKAKKESLIVGNVGIPLMSKALKSKEDTWMITEISSFQLETIKSFKPVISAILNLTPDHLDRHGSMENYALIKSRIFKNQDKNDYLVVNFDDKKVLALSAKSEAKIVPFSREEQLKFGAFIKEGRIVLIDESENFVDFYPVDQLKTIGDHNVENILAAVTICHLAGIGREVIVEVLKTFTGVAHRIELCGEVNGVRYINDSKATNIDAALMAINGVGENVLLIAGGYDKGDQFDKLIEGFNGKVKMAILIGTTAVKIKDAAEKQGFTDTIIVKDIESSVAEAARIAKPGDTVLLSPACASWDMYDNFEERGNIFKEAVKGLEK